MPAAAMSEMVAIGKVVLGEDRLRRGRTRHCRNGKEFSRFTWLRFQGALFDFTGSGGRGVSS
jgi:hypothetical protein